MKIYTTKFRYNLHYKFTINLNKETVRLFTYFTLSCNTNILIK